MSQLEIVRMNICDAQRQKQNESSLLFTFESLTNFITHNMADNKMLHTGQACGKFNFQFLLELARAGMASTFTSNEITGRTSYLVRLKSIMYPSDLSIKQET